MFNYLDYNMVLVYDFVFREWFLLNYFVNNVVVRYGYFLVLYKDKIYMYGGKIDLIGNVINELRVFYIYNELWVLLIFKVKEQYVVVGYFLYIVMLKNG